MIGQLELRNKLMSYNLDTLPHTILLLGEDGCGKHTLSKELADYFGIGLIDITDNINQETIESIYLSAFQTFYLINTSKITERQQNMLLKLIEEPSKLAYILLIGENKLSLLNTILNRCVIFDFKSYSIDELKQFTSEEDTRLFNLCTTPGQLKSMNLNKMDELYVLCTNILTKLSVARLPSTLNIVNKLNFKDNYDKFEVTVFFRALLQKSLELYTTGVINSSSYRIIDNYIKKSIDSRVNKNYLIQSMLIELWKESHNG